MTEDEEKAFRFGATEAFRAVRNMLNIDDQIVFHLEGHDCIEEFDLDDLIEFTHFYIHIHSLLEITVLTGYLSSCL